MNDDAKERQIPATLIVVGIGLYVLAAFVHTGPSGVGPTLLAVLIVGSIQTAILICAAFLVAMFLNVSFGDARAAILKFSGATLVSGGIAALIPYGGIVALFIFLGLIMWLFELDLAYAIALTVVYFVVAFAVALVLRAALQ